MINTSETSDPASREDRNDLRDRYREMGKTMKEKCVRYIEDNLTTFADYDNGSSEKITTTLKGGIVL